MSTPAIVWFDIPSTHAGLHLTATITNDIDEHDLVRRAAHREQHARKAGPRMRWDGLLSWNPC